jgi:flavin reductase (DIM6/NTAB) family NADH-FMN oxidoreductase RutF
MMKVDFPGRGRIDHRTPGNNLDEFRKSQGGSLNSFEDTVDPQLLRLAMRQWVTGVTIVTARAKGIQHGMTVSSFTSVSLTPPLVLVSLERGARTYEVVKESQAFGVTILDQAQQEVSNRFAGRETEAVDRFVGIKTFEMETGAPLLEGGLAAFDCRVTFEYPVGTHSLFIGQVVAVQTGSGQGPLVYFDRGYRRIGSAAG